MKDKKMYEYKIKFNKFLDEKRRMLCGLYDTRYLIGMSQYGIMSQK